MSAREDVLGFLAPREERIQVNGHEIIVREMATAADVAAFQDATDSHYKFIVRCVFDAQGVPLFTDEDIPALKGSARGKMLPIAAALNRVMGWDAGAEEKNSGAGPSAG